MKKDVDDMDTYEKKYNEALELAREFRRQAIAHNAEAEVFALESIFSELSESEDERIRKELVEYLTVTRQSDFVSRPDRQRWIEYLEKQKEQKPIMGDGIAAQTRPAYIFYNDTPEERKKAIDKFFPKTEQKPAWSEEDEKTVDDAYCWLCEYAGSLIQKNHEKSSRLYEIANRLKSLRPSWKPSEEDKHQVEVAIAFLKDYADKGYENAACCIDWLKSKFDGK